MRKILYVVNSSRFFLSHRLPVAKAALENGFEVHVATPSGEGTDNLVEHGFLYHALPMSRSGQNPFAELMTFIRFIILFWRLRPDLVHLVTIKPVLYGGIARWLSPVGAVVAAISGLGSVFRARTFSERLRRFGVSRMYRVALGGSRVAVIFQNESDQSLLIRIAGIRAEKSHLIRGSGVRLEDYAFRPEPEGTVRVVFASRLLQEKGVREFIEAARLLHVRGGDVQCVLAGDPDPGNPSSISNEELQAWRDEAIVQCLGFCHDIAGLFESCHIVVLPSYYGEGLPKVLIEAAAAGRAVITTDHPGCRDAILPGRTGLIVPVRNPEALADAIQRLVERKSERVSMGLEGRNLAENEFSVEQVVAHHLRIYRGLIGGQ